MSSETSLKLICLSIIACFLMSCERQETPLSNSKKDALVASSKAAPNVSKGWQKGIEYASDEYFLDNHCKPDNELRCLSLPEYQQACESAKKVTTIAVSMATLTSPEKTAIFKGGTLEAVNTNWINGACAVSLQASGIYGGNSTRVNASGTAVAFMIFEDGGEVAISRIR